MAKSAKWKGRRERKGRWGALSSCDGVRGGSGRYASACCWLLLLSLEQRQLPIAGVYGPQDNRVWERTQD